MNAITWRARRVRSSAVRLAYRMIGRMIGVDQWCDVCGVPNAGVGIYAGDDAESICRACAGVE